MDWERLIRIWQFSGLKKYTKSILAWFFVSYGPQSESRSRQRWSTCGSPEGMSGKGMRRKTWLRWSYRSCGRCDCRRCASAPSNGFVPVIASVVDSSVGIGSIPIVWTGPIKKVRRRAEIVDVDGSVTVEDAAIEVWIWVSDILEAGSELEIAIEESAAVKKVSMHTWNGFSAQGGFTNEEVEVDFEVVTGLDGVMVLEAGAGEDTTWGKLAFAF